MSKLKPNKTNLLTIGSLSENWKHYRNGQSCDGPVKFSFGRYDTSFNFQITMPYSVFIKYMNSLDKNAASQSSTKAFNSYSAGIDFSRQNLTSVDARF